MDNEELCECIDKTVHKDLVEKVLATIPDDDTIFDLAELFKLFGDSTRIKIIYSIYEKELCVCDIAEVVNMTQSAISHQLKNLKMARLVKSRKEGKVVYYSLNDEHIEKIFNQALVHIKERR